MKCNIAPLIKTLFNFNYVYIEYRTQLQRILRTDSRKKYLNLIRYSVASNSLLRSHCQQLQALSVLIKIFLSKEKLAERLVA